VLILQQKNKIFAPTSLYVLVNIFVSAVGFVRSFLFMRWLDMSDLGIISLVQTVIMFIGLFQLGLINGGYRIFALDKTEQQRDINNVLFSYFGILTGVALLFWTVLMVSGMRIIISNYLMLAALICGLLSLIMNWLTNTLIGRRLIKDINKVNITAATISIALLPLVTIWGIYGAIISIAAQPLVFITITLFQHKELRPTKWNFNFVLIRYILSFGFIPFLAGIFTILNLQIERWSIAKLLGTEMLGNFYLIFLYTTLFVLVPSSLNNLFFPLMVKSYEEKNMVLFKHNLKLYTVILVGYLVIATILTLTLLQPVVDWIFSNHSANTVYVYYFIPGLIAYVLCDPVGLIMNSMVKLRFMLIAGLSGAVVNIIAIVSINSNGLFSLTTMTFVKNTVNYTILVFYVIFFIKNYREILFNDSKINLSSSL
jgi:O-antigen/teichoic acid export membrane protein